MIRLELPGDFGVTEEHLLLRDEARRFLDERCSPSEVRRLAESPEGHDPALWKEMGRLGWAGLALPEEHGGAGLGHVPLALLLEEMGRRLVPSPFFACLLAGFALARAGDRSQRERWLNPIAAGETIATLAFTEPGGAFEPEHLTAQAEPVSGGFVLRGRKTHVPAAAVAGLLVAPFRVPSGEVALFALELPTPGVTIEPETGVDATRRTARVSFDGVRVASEARLGEDGATALADVLLRGAAALAAEMAGGADGVLELTRQYAIQRVQFGRPIGAFQAVKHPLVDTMIGVELARTQALAAAAALDHAPPQAESYTRMAKALAGEVFAAATRRAVQLHGGYGFTWECDAHLYLRRALWTCAVLGDALHHRQKLAQALFSANAE